MYRQSVSYFLAARLVAQERRPRIIDSREQRARARRRNMFRPLSLPEAEFRNRFRLTKDAYRHLNSQLQRRMHGSRRISKETKIICALSFYATGSYQRLVGTAENLSQKSVSKCINEVTDALNEMASVYIKFPTTRAQRDVLKNKFYNKYQLPGVIGCVDGCHFHIIKPRHDVEHLFYSRKHFHSLNVQMICDSDCRILNVNPKFGGATHDAFVWENSQANRYIQSLHAQQEFVWLLGDSGYPQREWLMTPITNAAPGSAEARYTQAHCKARVTIENTFGRLKNRWRCLSKDRTLHYTPKKCAKIVVACCVLHNIALDYNAPEPAQELPFDDVDPVVDEGQDERAAVGGRYLLARGRAMRSRIVNRFR